MGKKPSTAASIPEVLANDLESQLDDPQKWIKIDSGFVDRWPLFVSAEEQNDFYKSVHDTIKGIDYTPSKKASDKLRPLFQGTYYTRHPKTLSSKVGNIDDFCSTVLDLIIEDNPSFHEDHLLPFKLKPLYSSLVNKYQVDHEEVLQEHTRARIDYQLAFIAAKTYCYRQLPIVKPGRIERLKAIDKAVKNLIKLKLIHKSNWAKYEYWKNVQYQTKEELKLYKTNTQYSSFKPAIKFLKAYLKDPLITALIFDIFEYFERVEIIYKVPFPDIVLDDIKVSLYQHVSSLRAFSDFEIEAGHEFILTF
jgi:hypothetical protein